MKISVVINTRNAESLLAEAITSVKKIADEVVVCDMESEDGTLDIAKKLGAKIYKHKKEGYVEPARNFAINKATGDWVLILDADEKLTPQLLSLLKDKALNGEADFYRLPRKNLIFGKWMKHSRWWPDYNIRFFRKGFVTWNEVIHSVPMTTGKGEDISDSEENAIIHQNYRNLDEYLQRSIRYASIESVELIKNGYDFSWKDLVTKPANEFFSRYFFGLGYKDGIHGLAVGLLQSFSELLIYLKVWENKKFIENEVSLREVNHVISKNIKDLKYWQHESNFKETGNIMDFIKKKIR